MTVDQWSLSASGNAEINDLTFGSINFSHGQACASFNNSARSLMAHVKEWYTNIISYSAISTDVTLTVDNANSLVAADASGAAITVTLPAASAFPGLLIAIGKTDTSGNSVTIASAGADTIEGSASVAVSVQYGVMTLISDGVSTWRLISTTRAQVPIAAGFYNSAVTQIRTAGSGGAWIQCQYDKTAFNDGGGRFSANFYIPPKYGKYLVVAQAGGRVPHNFTDFAGHGGNAIAVSGDGGTTYHLLGYKQQGFRSRWLSPGEVSATDDNFCCYASGIVEVSDSSGIGVYWNPYYNSADQSYLTATLHSTVSTGYGAPTNYLTLVRLYGS